MQIHVYHHHIWPAEAPPWVARQLSLILTKMETNMSQRDDLKSALSTLSASLDQLKAELAARAEPDLSEEISQAKQLASEADQMRTSLQPQTGAAENTGTVPPNVSFQPSDGSAPTS